MSHSEERSRPAGNLDDLVHLVVDELEQAGVDELPAEEHAGPLEQPIHVQQS